MTQLRQRKAEFDRMGAELYCILPMDMIRTRSYQKKSAGPYMTISDPAGKACAIYGVSKQLVVHNEWVNSPSIFVVDRKGRITWAYKGNYWGDRPKPDTIIEEARKASK